GVLPIGLSLYRPEHWLLVAEAGINAIGVIDTRQNRVIGHVPAGWFPTRALAFGGALYAVNAKGRGTGPNHQPQTDGDTCQGTRRRGSISVFVVPKPDELPRLTEQVMRNNGFLPARETAPPLPAGIRHVVLIVKENRTFDEVFGDIASASNGAVAGLASLAR